MTSMTMPTLKPVVQRATDRVSGWLTRYSIPVLRISLGLVILGFGALKFIPGASPAEDLVMRTVDRLTFGIVSGQTAVLVTAVTEVLIGAILISGKFLRLVLLVVAGWLIGIMSPLVLFFTDMFPAGGPTLEAQYVLKDIVLGAAALVVAARAMGARLVRE